MYEVAKLADVSIATVSRVVNTDSRVKEKTRQKVLSAMVSLGYQPNSIAQSLATRTSNSVGVLVSELHGAFYGSICMTLMMLAGVSGPLIDTYFLGCNMERRQIIATKAVCQIFSHAAKFVPATKSPAF